MSKSSATPLASIVSELTDVKAILKSVSTEQSECNEKLNEIADLIAGLTKKLDSIFMGVSDRTPVSVVTEPKSKVKKSQVKEPKSKKEVKKRQVKEPKSKKVDSDDKLANVHLFNIMTFHTHAYETKTQDKFYENVYTKKHADEVIKEHEDELSKLSGDKLFNRQHKLIYQSLTSEQKESLREVMESERSAQTRLSNKLEVLAVEDEDTVEEKNSGSEPDTE